MSGQLYLTYRNAIYLLNYDKERIEIYSADNLQMVQTIRNLFVDIRGVINVGDGNFIAITGREAVFYALSTTSRKELFWKKMSTEMIDENIIAAEFCKGNNELILLSPNMIQAVECKKRDDSGFIKQSELSLRWMVSVKQELREMDISQDEELLALLSERGRVFIWNLRLVPTLFKKNMNLAELGDNSCAFVFEDVVKKVQFKKSIQQKTNCLFALSDNHLRVMQEVRDGPKFNFVNILNIRINGLTDFIQIDSICAQSKTLPANCLEFKNLESVDPIVFRVDNKFVMYQLYGVRSSRMKSSWKEIRQIQLGFTRLSSILFSSKGTLLFAGQKNQNIGQIQFDLNNSQNSKQQYIKVYLQIAECYFDQSSKYVVMRLEDGSYCRKGLTFDNWLTSHQESSDVVPLGIKTTSAACLHSDILYYVQNQQLHLYDVVANTSRTIPCQRVVRWMFFLKELSSGIYFVFDGDIIVLNGDKLQTLQKIAPSKQVIKVQVVNSSSSILFKTQRGYWLYQYFKQGEVLRLVEVKKSSEHLLYGGGYWAQLKEEEVVFGSKGRALVRFSLSSFLGMLSKKHGLKGFKYRLGHLQDQIFTLQIQNYFFFLAVSLDIRRQRYGVNVLRKNIHTNDYLIIRIPRKSNFEKTRLIYLNNCLYVWADKQLMIIGKYPQDPVGLDYQDLTQSVGYLNAYTHQPIPIQNPFFLKQLLSMGLFTQVDAILQDLSVIIREKPLDPFLTLPCQILSKFLNKELDGTKFEPNSLMEDLKVFQEITIQRPQQTGLTDNLPLLLSDIIDFARFRLQNQRSLDLPSSVFVMRVRRLLISKEKISTRDVCWALHTKNKQEVFMFLITQPLEKMQEGLSWKTLKKYCVVLWYDDVASTKLWLEKIALSQFRITKDPFSCLLWYILLGKKNILSALFKKDQKNIKTYEFLQRDFKEEKNRVAASKNAYALHSKKRYQHAVAFFILAGAYNDAVTVCLNQLEDPQLAILICKVFREEVGTQMVKSIFEKTFLQTGMAAGDSWMVHIAYNLLGQHLDSYNCLFEERFNFQIPTPQTGGPIVCDTWKADFQPELSQFHPSIMFFSNVVKESLGVKRQLQQKGEQLIHLPNPGNVINNSIDFYIHLNIPQLAIAFTIQNLSSLQLSAYRKRKLIDGYLNRLMALSIKSRSITAALAMIKQISELLEVSQSEMLDIFEEELKNIDCGDLLFDFYVETGNMVKIKTYIYNFKSELVMFMLHNRSRLETAQPFLIGFHLLFWGDQIVTKSQLLNMEVKDLQIYLTVIKIIILLRLECTKNLMGLLDSLLNLLSGKPVQYIIWDQKTYEQLKSVIPSRRNRIQTSKTSKKMDLLQEVFRKANADQTVSSAVPLESQLAFIVFTKLFFELLLCKIPSENFLQEIVVAQRKRADQLLGVFLTPERMSVIMTEYLEVVSNGIFVWNKTAVLCSNLKIDKDQIIPVLQLLGAQSYLTQKADCARHQQLTTNNKDSLALRQQLFKNGVEVFRNKTQLVRGFALNNFEGSQSEAVVLFKRSMRKFDIHSSLLNRPRNSEGCCLIEDDPPYHSNQSSRAANHQPLVTTCNGLLKSSFRRRHGGLIRYQKHVDMHLNDYLKQLDPLPFVNYNEINCVQSHRFLPLFFIGAKSAIDVYSFSDMKNFNRIGCRELGDVVKVATNYSNEMIGASDSDGNFSSFHFDSSYQGKVSTSVRKMNAVDFCYLWSNIVTIASKDGSINTIDPLLHTSRNVIFKEKLSGVSCVTFLPKNNILVVARKSQIYTYDIRRGGLSHMDAGNEIRSLTVDPMTEYIYSGTSNGQIRMFDCEGSDLATLRPFKTHKKPPTVNQLRISKGNLFALSSEGVITYALS